jgi:hypothetical protein
MLPAGLQGTDLVNALNDRLRRISVGTSTAATAATATNGTPASPVAVSERFWGYYKHGERVMLPVSPADGYRYARAELSYAWSLYSSAPPPAGGLNGTHAAPVPGANTGSGTLLGIQEDVNQTTGLVACISSYYSGVQTNTNDGVLMVSTYAQRAASS